MLGVLVDGEPRTRRRQLEQHPARLAEVDAQEVLAVDDRRRAGADPAQVVAPRGVLIVAIAPGDVVHAARALKPGFGGRVVVAVRGRAVATLDRVLPGRREREAQGLGQQPVLPLPRGAVHPNPVKPLERVLGRDVVGSRRQRRVVRVHDRELQAEAFGVGEPQRAVATARVEPHPVDREPLRPELKRLLRRHPPAQPVDHSRAGPSARRVGKLEERQDRSRGSPLVAVVQVVDVGRVEVDGLLDQPQPQQTRVEVDVAGRVRRDARDVVDAVKLHLGSWLGIRSALHIAEPVKCDQAGMFCRRT